MNGEIEGVTLNMTTKSTQLIRSQYVQTNQHRRLVCGREKHVTQICGLNKIMKTCIIKKQTPLFR